MTKPKETPQTLGTHREGRPESAEPKAALTTKKQLLIDMLRAEGGAELAALTDSTRWQVHTVRAALSRLKADGYVIERRSVEDGAPSRYFIAADPPVTADVQSADAPTAASSTLTAGAKTSSKLESRRKGRASGAPSSASRSARPGGAA